MRVTVAGATDCIVHKVQSEIDIEVSVKKSVTVADRFSLAMEVARSTRIGKLRLVRIAKMLGVPSGGGGQRCIKPMLKRIPEFVSKIPTLRLLCKLGVDTKQMVRAMGTPAIHTESRPLACQIRTCIKLALRWPKLQAQKEVGKTLT